jgi:molecular chaperone DnaK (HSP70)
MTNGRRIVVCVDFGTTYSAVAFYEGNTLDAQHKGVTSIESIPILPNDLEEIDGYPHAPQTAKHSVAEVPSELWYNGREVLMGYAIRKKVMYPVKEDGLRLHRFKLLLDDTERMSSERMTPARILQRLRKSPEDVITEYLTLLLEHTKSRLRRTHDYKEGTSVKLVVTVPAIWDTTALTIMTRAMERAALNTRFGQGNDVFLVSEPDAAATFFSEAELDLGLEAGYLK